MSDEGRGTEKVGLIFCSVVGIEATFLNKSGRVGVLWYAVGAPPLRELGMAARVRRDIFDTLGICPANLSIGRSLVGLISEALRVEIHLLCKPGEQPE